MKCREKHKAMTDLRPTNAGSCVVALDADVFIACFQLPAPFFAKLLPLPPQAGDGCVGYKDEGVVGTHTGVRPSQNIRVRRQERVKEGRHFSSLRKERLGLSSPVLL